MPNLVKGLNCLGYYGFASGWLGSSRYCHKDCPQGEHCCEVGWNAEPDTPCDLETAIAVMHERNRLEGLTDKLGGDSRHLMNNQFIASGGKASKPNAKLTGILPEDGNLLGV